MHISVVIPTCNRKNRLLSLLQSLDRSSCPLLEVIVVDSGENKLVPEDCTAFRNLRITCLVSEKSVCIQRNIGIRHAAGEWIFLCDDDIELPPDYLTVLTEHIRERPDVGALSGRWLQKEQGEWKAGYPVRSGAWLVWTYIFRLGIWGPVDAAGNNLVTRKIKRYYEKKGNHISIAGWPVNTNFSGDYVICPVYSLGAALVKKEWLLQSLFDEVLDRHGIGDNYGVAVGFPTIGIHVVNRTVAYHHKEGDNRLEKGLQYYRRILALDYFSRTKPALKSVKKRRILWLLTGNLLSFVYALDGRMARATLKAMVKIAFNRNPYFLANLVNKKITEPRL